MSHKVFVSYHHKNDSFYKDEFDKIAIVVLNQIIRPFTAKWHKKCLENAFDNSNDCKQFRKELTDLQKILIIYTQMLGQMAGVEDDLTKLEDE